MDIFTPASHHDILILIIQVGILLFSARILGEIAQRLKQPAVVGELLAGIILGPSLLSGFFPVINQWVVPQTPVEGYLIELVSMFGAIFLLIITGLETDIPLIKSRKKTAFSIAAGGLIVPFLSGFIMSIYLPDFLVANSQERIVFDLFVATAMAISSIPVVAKVLMDLNLMRRDFGQTVLASGMIDDTTAWVMLSIILGLASGEAITTGTVLFAIGKIVAFMVLSFTVGKWLVRKGLHYVQDHSESKFAILTYVVFIAFVFGAIAQAIKVEAVLGAFVAGIIFGMLPRLPKEVVHMLEAIAIGIFAPIFFAVSGLKVDIVSLLRPDLLLITGIVVFIAIFGKFVGAYLGARFIGLSHWNSLAFGSALNARGAVEIIIASIGLSMGILSKDMYSIIVVMAMITSLMAPSLLKWTVSKVKMSSEERERLRKEELQANSMVAGIHRILLPIRPRFNGNAQTPSLTRYEIESKVLEMFGRNNQISITLMTVASKSQTAESRAYLKTIGGIFENMEVETKVVEADKPIEAILDEAKKDYHLLVLGVAEKNTNGPQLFNPIIDELVRRSPCPTATIFAKEIYDNWVPDRILVPTDGSKASKNAAEFSFHIADSESQEVLILNVIEKKGNWWSYLQFGEDPADRKAEWGKTTVNEYKTLGKAFNIKTRTAVIEDKSIERGIVRTSQLEKTNLIIMGTSIYQEGRSLYFGRKVENILEDSTCPVLVFNS